jgi:carboxymethylenebutenolidase
MIQLDYDGGLDAYVARPPAAVNNGAPKGGLIVIHEIWGLVDHIKDVADRFAAEGYLVIAPDLLSKVGITPQLGIELLEIRFSPDEKVRSEGQPKLRDAFSVMRAPEYAAWAVPALQKCVDYLEEQPGTDGGIAVTGFCFGGSYSFALAAADSRIAAAVPFYGQPPESSEVKNIACPVLAFYGETDESLIETLPAVTAAMTDAGVDFTSKVYDGTGHAFFNDTNPHTYNAEIASDAWERSLAFLDAAVLAPRVVLAE